MLNVDIRAQIAFILYIYFFIVYLLESLFFFFVCIFLHRSLRAMKNETMCSFVCFQRGRCGDWSWTDSVESFIFVVVAFTSSAQKVLPSWHVRNFYCINK